MWLIEAQELVFVVRFVVAVGAIGAIGAVYINLRQSIRQSLVEAGNAISISNLLRTQTAEWC